MENSNITKFETGAVRDSQAGKPCFFESVAWSSLWGFGEYMAEKAAKYGPGNFKKGIPAESYLESLNRHVVKLNALEECKKFGWPVQKWMEPNERHDRAIIFNALGYSLAKNLEEYSD